MDIIVDLTIGLMIAKIGCNIISGYLSVNPSKKAALKRFFGMGGYKSKNSNK